MKIVDRKTFLALPSGTLYVKCCGYGFGDICVKRESLENDWTYIALSGKIDDFGSDLFDKLDQYEKTSESFEFDLNIVSRDGLFEEEEKYCVYEPKDIEMLIKALQFYKK